MEEKLIIEHKLKLAEDFEAQGKQLHAIQIYSSLLDKYPLLMEACFSLAEIYQRCDNINAASEIISSMIESDSESIEKRMYAGQFYLKYAMWNEAIDVLEYIMVEEESYVSYLRGFAYYQLGDYELSKLNFLNYVVRESDNSLKHEGYLFLAKISIELKDFQAAENFLKKIENTYSSHWEFHYLSAVVYQNNGMLEHAITKIEKAVKLNSKNPEVFALAGQLQLKHGNYKNAERRFLKCIELKEYLSSEVYTGLAEACLNSNKMKDALAYYDTALKLDPDNGTALKGKATAEYKIKNGIGSDG